MFNQIKKRLQSRQYAGWLLAEKLLTLNPKDTVVLAIPKGGIPVGRTIASILGFSFDIAFSKRIKHPAHADQSIGAVTLDDVVVHDTPEKIPQGYILQQIASLRQALIEEHEQYSVGVEKPSLKGKIVVMVDDVIRETDELEACFNAVVKHSPLRVIVAAPVITLSAFNFLNDHDIETHCLFTEMNHQNHAYTFFSEITEEELKVI